MARLSHSNILRALLVSIFKAARFGCLFCSSLSRMRNASWNSKIDVPNRYFFFFYLEDSFRLGLPTYRTDSGDMLNPVPMETRYKETNLLWPYFTKHEMNFCQVLS